MKKIFLGFILGLSLSSLYLIYAWVNPTQNPPQGGGVLQTDSSGLNIITTTRVSSGNFLVTSGNVGIGTTAPEAKLHIRSDTNSPLEVLIRNDNLGSSADARLTISTGWGGATADPILQFAIPGVRDWIIGIDNADGDKFKIARDFTNNFNNTAIAIDILNNVGIGTTAPESKLDVRGFIQTKGPLTNQYSASGFNLKADETVNYWHIGYRGSLSNQQGSLAFWYYNGSNWIQPLVLSPSGRVGIHTGNPNSVFTIVNPNNPNEYIETFTDAGIHLRNTSLIADTGIATPLVSPASTRHVCQNQNNVLSPCSSDAEYAPMEENVEEGDVVMISELENPIKDDEAPFVLKKANKPYSSLIMGVVTNEEKGASGIKKSYFYKPLGIYGYFKVKVSTINGAIKKGDFLTASNIPGVAMKMTKPGRTIGIALENYDKEGIGIIRFFANLSWVDPTINNE